MIATITLNPSLDRTITVDGLKIDETNRWKSVHLYAGGKGIDVSRAVHEMGGDTVAYGFIGGDTGRTVEILLDEEGVPFSFTPIDQDIRTNFIITDTKTPANQNWCPWPAYLRKGASPFSSKNERA